MPEGEGKRNKILSDTDTLWPTKKPKKTKQVKLGKNSYCCVTNNSARPTLL